MDFNFEEFWNRAVGIFRDFLKFLRFLFFGDTGGFLFIFLENFVGDFDFGIKIL
jgi:hypothetical protein